MEQKHLLEQYLLQDISSIDIKLLLGVYSKKVLGFEEIPGEEIPLLERIKLARGHKYEGIPRGQTVLTDVGIKHFPADLVSQSDASN